MAETDNGGGGSGGGSTDGSGGSSGSGGSTFGELVDRYTDPKASPRNRFQFGKLFRDFIEAIVVAVFMMLAAGVQAWREALGMIADSIEYLMGAPVLALRLELTDLTETAARVAEGQFAQFGIAALPLSAASALAALLVLVVGINIFLTRTSE